MSSNSKLVLTFTFGQILLGKAWTLLSSYSWLDSITVVLLRRVLYHQVNQEVWYHHHHHHVVPLARISLTLSLSPLLHIVQGLQGYIPYSHIAAVCMFELVVLLLPGHMWGSIRVQKLWARPCFSSSVLHIWFVSLG